MTNLETPIADQSSTVRQNMAEHAPAEILAIALAEQSALEAAGVPTTIAATGSTMPDGELLDVTGGPATLAQARDGKPTVVVFYRGVWCPFCNIMLRTYQEQVVAALEDLGGRLVAISPQKPDGSLSMQQKHELSFAVLSDPGNQIAGQLGILSIPSSPAMLEAQAQLGVDRSAVNADGTPAVPMPTVVLVDADGIIRWIDVHPNYTGRTEPAEILAAYQRYL